MNNRYRTKFEIYDGFIETNVEPFTDKNGTLGFQFTVYPGVKKFGPNSSYVKVTETNVPPSDPKEEKEIYDDYEENDNYKVCPDCGCFLASSFRDSRLNELRCKDYISDANVDSKSICDGIVFAMKRFEHEVRRVIESHGYKKVEK